MPRGNLSVISPEPPIKPVKLGPVDGDGEDGGPPPNLEIQIHCVDNGYVLSKNSGENVLEQKIFLFRDGDHGPRELIQTIIYELGLYEKVKLSK